VVLVDFDQHYYKLISKDKIASKFDRTDALEYNEEKNPGVKNKYLAM